jgi:polyisoprenoid-binding protein YceI
MTLISGLRQARNLGVTAAGADATSFQRWPTPTMVSALNRSFTVHEEAVMRWLTWLATPLLALTSTVPALMQGDLDSVKVDPAHHQVVFENDQVRVVRWVIAVGGKTLSHSHPKNLSIALTDYNGKVTTPDGASNDVYLEAGSATWREAGVHVVQNLGKQPMTGVIIEPKKPGSARPAGSADPMTVDPQHHKVEFENEQVRVVHERQSGSFPLHGHPDNVRVLLTDMNVRLTAADGETQIVTGKAGEVHWRTATQHAGSNLADQPFEQIVVEMKRTPGSPTGRQ